ncbi:MAG TPA: hypothetical protein VF779_05450 [Pyrinomonadaceae bacterium]
MTEAKCSCSRLERLEGASVNAYICSYLLSEEKNRFRCRICGREWEKHYPESKSEGKRPSLIRLS